MQMAWRSQLVLLIALGVYVLLGGMVFHVLEFRHHAERIEEEDALQELVQKFILAHPGVSEDDLNVLIRTVIRVSKGYKLQPIGDKNCLLNEPIWDLPNSIFFATTVITTIGYGTLSPITLGGRIFCVIYGMFGIPLFLLTLSGVGIRINTQIQRLADRITARYHTSRVTRAMRAVVILAAGSCIFLFLPAAMFSVMEEWTVGEGIYYAFVTLSTIGFGDFIAGMDSTFQYPSWYILARQCWLFLGLAWLSAVIGSHQEVFKDICRSVSTLQNLVWQDRGSGKATASDDSQSDDDVVIEYV